MLRQVHGRQTKLGLKILCFQGEKDLFLMVFDRYLEMAYISRLSYDICMHLHDPDM